jgi:hypothetical protein
MSIRKEATEYRPWARRAVGFVFVVVMTLVASKGAQNPASTQGAQSAGPSPAAPASPARPAVIDPKARQSLDKTIQALGGDAFLRSTTLTTRGRVFSIQDEVTVGMVPFQSWFQYPDKRRFSYGKDKPVVLINNGEEGWELDQFGRVSQKPDQVRNWRLVTRYTLENLLRLRIHEPGTLVQDSGVDFVENLPAHVLEIFDDQHTQVKLYLDTRNFLPIRITYRIRNPKTQDWNDYADVYSDYQPFQGIQTAMHIGRFVDDERVSEVYRNSARYNETYPPEYFQPVEVK